MNRESTRSRIIQKLQDDVDAAEKAIRILKKQLMARGGMSEDSVNRILSDSQFYAEIIAQDKERSEASRKEYQEKLNALRQEYDAKISELEANSRHRSGKDALSSIPHQRSSSSSSSFSATLDDASEDVRRKGVFYEREVERLEIALADSLAAKDALQMRLEATISNFSKLDATLHTYKAENDSLKKQLTAVDNVQAEGSKYKAKCAGLEVDLEHAQSQLKSTSAKYRELSEQMEQLKEKLRTAKEAARTSAASATSSSAADVGVRQKMTDLLKKEEQIAVKERALLLKERSVAAKERDIEARQSTLAVKPSAVAGNGSVGASSASVMPPSNEVVKLRENLRIKEKYIEDMKVVFEMRMREIKEKNAAYACLLRLHGISTTASGSNPPTLASRATKRPASAAKGSVADDAASETFNFEEQMSLAEQLRTWKDRYAKLYAHVSGELEKYAVLQEEGRIREESLQSHVEVLQKQLAKIERDHFRMLPQFELLQKTHESLLNDYSKDRKQLQAVMSVWEKKTGKGGQSGDSDSFDGKKKSIFHDLLSKTKVRDVDSFYAERQRFKDEINFRDSLIQELDTTIVALSKKLQEVEKENSLLRAHGTNIEPTNGSFVASSLQGFHVPTSGAFAVANQRPTDPENAVEDESAMLAMVSEAKAMLAKNQTMRNEWCTLLSIPAPQVADEHPNLPILSATPKASAIAATHGSSVRPTPIKGFMGASVDQFPVHFASSDTAEAFYPSSSVPSIADPPSSKSDRPLVATDANTEDLETFSEPDASEPSVHVQDHDAMQQETFSEPEVSSPSLGGEDLEAFSEPDASDPSVHDHDEQQETFSEPDASDPSLGEPDFDLGDDDDPIHSKR
eukprot:ANDGO_08152.mRNA.1 hypothetical protein